MTNKYIKNKSNETSATVLNRTYDELLNDMLGFDFGTVLPGGNLPSSCIDFVGKVN